MVGISGGIGASRLHGNTIMHPSSDPVAGLQCNQSYTRWLKGGIGIQSQLTMSTMGGALNENGPKSHGFFSGPAYQYNFTHLGLSVGAAYRTLKRLHGVVSLGIMPSYILLASSLSRSYYPEPGRTISSGISTSVNRAIIFGYGAIGAGFHFKGPLTLGILARYDRGLNSLSKPFFFVSENLTESCWTIAVTVACRWPR